MSAQVVARHELVIASEDDVVIVRRRVKSVAQSQGFDAFAIAALTTATSELTRNVWMHAGKGTAIIEELNENERAGLRVEFRDDGPGIADIKRVLEGGYSTARSLGMGLSGSRRLVDEFEIDSTPGRGTRVQITKWTRF